MSKFIDLIRATRVNEQKFDPYRAYSAKVELDPHSSITSATMNRLDRFDMGVIFESSAYIDMDAPDALAHAVRAAQRRSLEAVFGEFRMPLHELRHALYEHDFVKARDALTALEHQMFDL